MNRLFACISLAVVLGGCYHEHNYDSLTGSDTLLMLRTEPTKTLPADGTSRLTIIATIATNADPTKRTIVFETTTGTLVGGTVSGSGHAVTAGPNGEAAIQLQSSAVVETAIVTASVSGVAYVVGRLEVPFVAIDPATVIRFTTAPASAPADGATTSTFVVQVANAAALPIASRTVTFGATLGTLVESSTLLDSNGTARALLRSPATAGVGRLRATVGTFVNDVLIRFDPALPDALTISSDKFAIKNDLKETAALTIQLRRDTGTASMNTEIALRATDRNGNSIGVFGANPIYSDATGKATASFAVPGTDYEGPVTVIAAATGTKVTGSTVVQVTK
jgi:hypothetical protein